MMIRGKFDCLASDIRELQYFHFRHGPDKGMLHLPWYLRWPLMFVTVWLACFWMYVGLPEEVAAKQNFIILGVCAVVLVWTVRLARIYKRLYLRHGTKLVAASAESICVTSAKVRSEYRWDYFIHAGETKSLFIFYLDIRHGLLIPKRAFGSEADVEAFRQLVAKGRKRDCGSYPLTVSDAGSAES